MKSYRILPAAFLLCTLGACAESPTSSTPTSRPGGASFDSGYTIGSGGGVQAGGSERGGESEQMNAPANTTTTGDDGQRSGYTIGSGG